MKIHKTTDFEKQAQKLPAKTQQALEKQFQYFLENPRHPSLKTKKLQDLEGVYSIRVGRSYRALFFFSEANIAIFFAIGHRKQIYR